MSYYGTESSWPSHRFIGFAFILCNCTGKLLRNEAYIHSIQDPTQIRSHTYHSANFVTINGEVVNLDYSFGIYKRLPSESL